MRTIGLVAAFSGAMSACSSGTEALEYSNAQDVRSSACVSVYLDGKTSFDEGPQNENIGLGTLQTQMAKALFNVYDLETAAPITGADLDYWVSQQFVPVAYPSVYGDFREALEANDIVEANVSAYGGKDGDSDEVEITVDFGEESILAVLVRQCAEWVSIDGEQVHTMASPE